MKDNSGKVLLALLAGASAGIVAGLLLAPEAGSETRSSLGKSLGKLGEDLSKLAQDGLAKLDDLKTQAGSAISEARSEAEDALASINKPAAPKADTGTTPDTPTGGSGVGS